MKLLVLAGLAVAVAAVAAGCGHASSTAPPARTPGSTATTVTPSATPSAGRIDRATTGSVGSDGLTVRYRDADGGLKTVRVEDFPR